MLSSLIFIGAFFAVSLFAPENIVSIVIGVLTTLGVTQFLKNWTGLFGFGATILALVIAGAVGLLTVLVQMAFSGDFSAAAFVSNAASIFTIGTVAYRALQTAFADEK